MALRELALSPKSPIHRREYYDRELTDTLRSFRPGEWAMLTQGGKPLWIAMVNPYSENGPKARALVPWSASYKQLDEDALAAKLIPELITRAIEWRAGWKRLSSGARLIYGDADGLPGLVVDSYQEVILAQLNSAGLDRHRELVRDELARLTGKKVYLYDSPEYRKNEGLPSFTSEIDFSELKIVESGITFTISREVLQKIGHYYDHRDNRRKLADAILGLEKTPSTGIDLFSYAGAWGLSALKAGVGRMTFVDQGNFDSTITRALKDNDLEGRGSFFRGDVFDFLEQQKEDGKKHDLVISDPPAFAKSVKNKHQAIGGYEKLHALCLTVTAPGGLFACASCTHGVSLEELDRTVFEAQKRVGREAYLIDVGIQGPDHSIRQLHDNGSYIKYLLYRVR